MIDKARGVGGRCATRRVEDQPVDHGVAFLHGSSPAFLDAIASVGAAGAGTIIAEWPREVRGTGTPCQPDAFTPGESRFVFAEGVSAFPKHLAGELPVTLRTRVVSLGIDRSSIVAALEDGSRVDATTLVLALPLEQARELLDPLPQGLPELDGFRELLAMIGTLPCLTLIAAYPHDAGEPPGWDICFPESSRLLLLLSHDSAKRRDPALRMMVYQAHPGWSHDRLEGDPAGWGAAMLEEAGRLIGAWAATPHLLQTHRWRYARVDRGTEFSSPVLLDLGGGLRLGLAGELFSPGGGIEAAYLSGCRLADRLLQE